MRIAISGTHCSGKSTLIDAFLLAHTEYVHEPEAYEALQDIYDESPAEPSADDFFRQLEYHVEQLHQYRAGDSVVFERSPVDYVAYLLALGDLKRHTADAQLAERAIELAKGVITLLDSIVFVRARDVSVDVDDSEDPKLRRAVDARLESILLNDDLDLFIADRPLVFEAVGTTAQRLQAVECRTTIALDTDRRRKAMTEKVTPMIHVPDVRATVDWYRDIGFTVNETYGHDGEGLSFAIVSFGTSQVMFNEGGRPSTQRRREVDLYIDSDDVDALYERLKDRVEIVEGLHETFYGMREFIIRDINRFWITFGQPTAFSVLMYAIQHDDTEAVRITLERAGIGPEALAVALAVVSADNEAGNNKNVEIRELLEKAGAVPPPELEARVLQSYTGKYRSHRGMEVDIRLEDNRLIALPSGQQPISLIAVDETTFRPVAFERVRVVFDVESGKAIGFSLKDGSSVTKLKRVEDISQ